MKLKFGMIVTDADGKLGGTVVSRNHFGRFARTYVVPADPASPDQMARRALFQTASLLWPTIGSAKQALWIAAAMLYPRTNSIGDIYYPTGQNLFVELNTNLAFIGSAMVSTPPTKVIPPAPPPFTSLPKESGGIFWLTFLAPYTDATVINCIKVTSSLSPGINFVSTALRNLEQFPHTGSAIIDIYSNYNAKYGAMLIGQQVFVQIYRIDKTSGSATFGAPVGAIVV